MHLFRSEPFFRYTGFLFILLGLGLTFASFLEQCTSCEAVHQYRLFGLPFEYAGFLYFPLLAIAYWLSRTSKTMLYAAGALLSAGLGAELAFIFFQKFVLKQWCLLCLSIAVVLLCAAAMFFLNLFLNTAKIDGKTINFVHKLKSAVIYALIFIIGTATAFSGIEKEDKIALAETSLEQSLIIGNPNSTTVVYIFTSWGCPACKKLEPSLKSIVDAISPTTQIFFIDHLSDLKTINFSPYNLSFLKYNKQDYVELRKVLRGIAADTEEPTDEQIEKALRTVGSKYTRMSFSDIELGMDYFKQMSMKYNISSLPLAVVLNTKSNQSIILRGNQGISKASVLKAIEDVQNTKPQEAK